MPYGGLNSRQTVADFRVEQNPEGEVPSGFGAHLRRVEASAEARRRSCEQEARGMSNVRRGSGVGDGVRLRGRNKALEGATP